MIVQDFIDELSRRLRDVSKKQWDDDFLISALNAAIGALTTVLPQAFTVNRDLTLAQGVEQTIDDDLHRIVSLLHNVSSVDGTPRRAITKADMSVFDAAYPHWRQDKVRSYIRHWFIDEYDESKFYVWPPAAALRGDAPIVPELPIEPTPPVDPGPLVIEPGTLEIDAVSVVSGYGSSIYFKHRDDSRTDSALVNDEFTIGDTVYIHFTEPPIGNAVNQGWGIHTLSLLFPSTSTYTQVQNTPGVDSVGLTVDSTNSDDYVYPDDTRWVQGRAFVLRTIWYSDWFEIVDFDATVPGNQAEFDAYQQALPAYDDAMVIYNAQVADRESQIVALNIYNALPLPHIVRGTFTYTPYIDQSIPPTVPPIPQAPVDPGNGTQEQIDAYQAAVSHYDEQLIAYNLAAQALDDFNARDVVRSTSELPVKRQHYQALQEFAMYYAYSIDDDMTANSGRAQRHWLAFFQLLNKREDSNLRLSESTELTE